ncbi:MAG: hypothetical protein ACREHG_09220, partial [Candidatus Saccharimonadales bacterium]
IKARLCNQDWDISENPFLFLRDQRDQKIIVRGKSVYNFSQTHWGDQCDIRLKKTSAAYNANSESQKVATDQLVTITKRGYEILQEAAKNNYHLTAAEQKTSDSLKPVREKLNTRLKSLFHAQHIASVSIDFNSNWMDQEKMSGFPAAKAGLLHHIPGVDQFVLNVELPYEDNPDTSYSLGLYIGRWPQPNLTKMMPFTFRHNAKTPWTDKDHSGPPIIENFRVVISSYHYNQIIHIIQAIDWTKLKAMVKG